MLAHTGASPKSLSLFKSFLLIQRHKALGLDAQSSSRLTREALATLALLESVGAVEVLPRPHVFVLAAPVEVSRRQQERPSMLLQLHHQCLEASAIV